MAANAVTDWSWTTGTGFDSPALGVRFEDLAKATEVGRALATWAADRADLPAAVRNTLALASGSGQLSQLGTILAHVAATMPCGLPFMENTDPMQGDGAKGDANKCLLPGVQHLPRPAESLRRFQATEIRGFRDTGDLIVLHPVAPGRPTWTSQHLPQGVAPTGIQVQPAYPAFLLSAHAAPWYGPGAEIELLFANLISGQGYMVMGQGLYPLTDIRAVPWDAFQPWGGFDPNGDGDRAKAFRYRWSDHILAVAEHPELDTVRIVCVHGTVYTLRDFLRYVLHAGLDLGPLTALWLVAGPLSALDTTGIPSAAARAASNAFVAALWCRLNSFATAHVPWRRVPTWVTPDKLSAYLDAVLPGRVAEVVAPREAEVPVADPADVPAVRTGVPVEPPEAVPDVEVLSTPTTKVYPWIVPLLGKAAEALGATIDPKPLGGGWNGQVFATTDGRIVKITANAEEVRAFQVLTLTEAGRALIPRIDRIAYLGPSGRDPDVQGDPADAYALLREAVTPLGPTAESEGVPIAYDKIPSMEMNPSTSLLKDNRFSSKGFMRAIRAGRPQVASAWMTDLGTLLAWCRRLNLTDEIPRVRAKWRGAARHASREDLRALATIGNAWQGAFIDVATTQQGRTADGRVVFFDLGFVDSAPGPVHVLAADIEARWPPSAATTTPEPLQDRPAIVDTPEGPVGITLGAKGKRHDWHNIHLGKRRFGWNGERWARGEEPPNVVLAAVRRAGYTEFPGPPLPFEESEVGEGSVADAGEDETPTSPTPAIPAYATDLVLDLTDPSPVTTPDPALDAAIARVLALPRPATPLEAVRFFVRRPVLRGPITLDRRFLPTIRDALLISGYDPAQVDLPALQRDLGLEEIHTDMWLDSPWTLAVVGVRGELRRDRPGYAWAVDMPSWSWVVPYVVLDALRVDMGRTLTEIVSLHNAFLMGSRLSDAGHGRFSRASGHDWTYDARWLVYAFVVHALRDDWGDADHYLRVDELLHPRSDGFRWWLDGRPPERGHIDMPPVPESLKQVRAPAALEELLRASIRAWKVPLEVDKAGWDEYALKATIAGFEFQASRGHVIHRSVPALMRTVHEALPAVAMLRSLGLSGGRNDRWSAGLVRKLSVRYSATGGEP